MKKDELIKEVERLNFLLNNHKEAYERIDLKLEEKEKEIKEINLYILNLKKVNDDLNLQLKIKNNEIQSLEDEVLARCIGDIRKNRKEKRANGELICEELLDSNWKNLFYGLPEKTRNRFVDKAEKFIDAKGKNIPKVKKYQLEHVFLPKILYEEGFFLKSQEEIKKYNLFLVEGMQKRKETLNKKYEDTNKLILNILEGIK